MGGWVGDRLGTSGMFKKPKVPPPPTPEKAPDSELVRQRQRDRVAQMRGLSATMLTGPTGVRSSGTTLGMPTLLGG